MNQRLKNLYTYLVGHRKHYLIGWYKAYETFILDIEKIRTKLNEGKSLRDKETYKQTSFSSTDDPFDYFIKKLLYERSNGISSRGQSVISLQNLNSFKTSNGFDDIIKSIVVKKDFQAYKNFKEWWKNQKVGNNPVLINRAIAACTTDVSTTVDEGKFNHIFYWLQKEDLIATYPSENQQDWFSKNLYTIKEISKGLQGYPEIDKYWISLFVWEMYVNISNPFSLKKQIVKYGAPGTGKTFTAKQNSKLLFEIWKDEYASTEQISYLDQIETVQFHPSYTYEDFIEGLRPKLDKSGQSQLVLRNGIFKEFCIRASKWENDIYELKTKNNAVKDWLNLTIEDITQYKNVLSGEHWNYIYNITDKSKKVSDAVPPFFFIIDEINRAELSRVFGELMFCLEYRGTKGLIKTQYNELNDSKTGMIKVRNSYQFYIPNNIYMIGTMNTIDRSVESFDFALRRRFKWEEVLPNTSLLYYHLLSHNEKWKELAENLENLNNMINSEPLLGRDFQIGHAYLWDLPYSKELSLTEIREKVWEDSIEPLLQEYLRGTGREDLLNKFANKFGL